MALATNVLKWKKFKWTDQKAFKIVKKKLTSAPILTLPNIAKVFELEYDASGIWTEAMLTQQGKPIVYFNEKLSDAARKFSTYNKEFYAIIRAWEHSRHCFIGSEFILHFNHEARKFIQD